MYLAPQFVPEMLVPLKYMRLSLFTPKVKNSHQSLPFLCSKDINLGSSSHFYHNKIKATEDGGEAMTSKG